MKWLSDMPSQMEKELWGVGERNVAWPLVVLEPGADVKSLVMSTSGWSLQDHDTYVEGHVLQMFCVCKHSCLSKGVEVGS